MFLAVLHTIVRVDPLLLTVALGSGIPLIRALLTKSTWPQQLKTGIGLALSLVAGGLVGIQSNNGVVSRETLLAAILAFVTAQAVHYGVWEPTGVAKTVDNITG